VSPEPSVALRPLRRVRQVRQFTDEPLTDAEIDAVVDVGRWSGSSRNSQPWRFVVVRDGTTVSRIAELGAPHTRALTTARAAIAVALPADPEHAVSLAFDDGRASERMLIAANLLGLAAAIAWLPLGVRPSVAELLRLPPDRAVRTILALGHAAPEALAPKSPAGQARLPRSETVMSERWRAPRGQ
jgi:nitroreductase